MLRLADKMRLRPQRNEKIANDEEKPRPTRGAPTPLQLSHGAHILLGKLCEVWLPSVLGTPLFHQITTCRNHLLKQKTSHGESNTRPLCKPVRSRERHRYPLRQNRQHHSSKFGRRKTPMYPGAASPLCTIAECRFKMTISYPFAFAKPSRYDRPYA